MAKTVLVCFGVRNREVTFVPGSCEKDDLKTAVLNTFSDVFNLENKLIFQVCMCIIYGPFRSIKNGTGSEQQKMATPTKSTMHADDLCTYCN